MPSPSRVDARPRAHRVERPVCQTRRASAARPLGRARALDPVVSAPPRPHPLLDDDRSVGADELGEQAARPRRPRRRSPRLTTRGGSPSSVSSSIALASAAALLGADSGRESRLRHDPAREPLRSPAQWVPPDREGRGVTLTSRFARRRAPRDSGAVVIEERAEAHRASGNVSIGDEEIGIGHAVAHRRRERVQEDALGRHRQLGQRRARREHGAKALRRCTPAAHDTADDVILVGYAEAPVQFAERVEIASRAVDERSSRSARECPAPSAAESPRRPASKFPWPAKVDRLSAASCESRESWIAQSRSASGSSSSSIRSVKSVPFERAIVGRMRRDLDQRGRERRKHEHLAARDPDGAESESRRLFDRRQHRVGSESATIGDAAGATRSGSTRT